MTVDDDRTLLVLRREHAEDFGTRYAITITHAGVVRYARAWGAIKHGRTQLDPAELRRLIDAFEAAAFARLPPAVNVICDAEQATLRLLDHEVTWFSRSRETAVLDRLESLVLDLLGIPTARGED